MQGLHLRLGVLELCEDRAGPWILLVRIEIAAKHYHQIDVLADIAFAMESVSRGALHSVTDCLAQVGFAGGFALFREELPQVVEHPLFEPRSIRLRECRELCSSNR